MTPKELPEPAEVTVELEKITPEIAQQLLDATPENQRNRRTAQVERYMRDMLQHNWHDNGETIKIDTRGRLIDGQHRMQAVVESKMTVEMRVARNVQPEAIHSIDIGVARKYADLLKLSNEQHPGVTSVFLRRLYMWERGIKTAKGNLVPSPAELDQLLTTNRQLIQIAVARGIDVQREFRPLTAAVGAMAYYLFARIDENSVQEADAFFDKLMDGGGMDRFHPIFRLRERLREPPAGRKFTSDEKLALVIRAWNHFRAKAAVETLVLSPKGALNDANFPEPK